jgi:hypothetical protein
VDQEVLRLLGESMNSVRSLLVVNQNSDTAQEAHDRIMEQCGGASSPGPGPSNSDFNAWAQSAELGDYFASLD